MIQITTRSCYLNGTYAFELPLHGKLNMIWKPEVDCHAIGSLNIMGGHYGWTRAILTTAVTALIAAASADAAQVGGWHLLRTANPHGGADAVSISHTADITRSDPDLAGLMLRCGEIGAEVVIVAISTFPPCAQPGVTIGADGKEWRFETRVVPPGAELLLPAQATALAMGPWQSAHEITVKISSPEQSFGGVIAIDGLGAALATLSANCPTG
jgi:hypothetical protein